MSTRVAGAIVGAVFGVTLVWSGLTDPAVIRRGLLFEDSYLFLFFAAALGVAFAGSQLLRRARPRALLTGERVEWADERPKRPQLGGAVVFGIGWGIGGACPGPIAAQLGQGVAWSLFTITGVVIGIVLFLRREARRSQAQVAPAAAPGDATTPGPRSAGGAAALPAGPRAG